MLGTFVALGIFIVVAVLFILAVLYWRSWNIEGNGLIKAIIFTVLFVAFITGVYICYNAGYLSFIDHPDTLERNGYTYVRSDEPVKVIEHNGYEYYLEEVEKGN